MGANSLYLLAVNPTRLEAVTARDQTLIRWSLRDGTPTMLTQITDERRQFCAIAVAPEGEYLAVASLAPIIDRQGETDFSFYPSGPGYSDSDGDTFAPCVIELCQWRDLTVAQTIPLPGSGASVPSLCFSPDGRWLAATDGRGLVYLIDRQTNQVAQTLTDFGGDDMSGLAFDPTSGYLAIGYSDIGEGGVALYRLENGALHRVIEDYFADFTVSTDYGTQHGLWLRESIFQLAFSPDGATLAVATNDNNEQTGFLVAFDAQSGQPRWSLELYPEVELADGSHLHPLFIYNGHYYCSQLCFTRNGGELISGDGGGDLLCFAAADGLLTRRLGNGTNLPVALLGLESSGEGVWALVFRDDPLHDRYSNKQPPADEAQSADADAGSAGDGMRLVRVALTQGNG